MARGIREEDLEEENVEQGQRNKEEVPEEGGKNE